LRTIVRRFYSDIYSKVQIVPANGDIKKQDKSIRVVDSAYELFKSEINPYSDKIVVLVDAPNESNQSHYNDFKAAHSELIKSDRYIELPESSLEEYYPGSHKANPNSVAGRVGGKSVYAETVAEAMAQDDFEREMPVVKTALEKALSGGFGNRS
jgi:hypothetical protein